MEEQGTYRRFASAHRRAISRRIRSCGPSLPGSRNAIGPTYTMESLQGVQMQPDVLHT